MLQVSLVFLLKGLNGKPVRTGKNQHNPGTAPATVSEFKPIIQPLRFFTWEGDQLVEIPLVSPETGLKSLTSIAEGDAVAGASFFLFLSIFPLRVFYITYLRTGEYV